VKTHKSYIIKKRLNNKVSFVEFIFMHGHALLKYVNLIVWMRSVNKMLPSAKFAEYKVLTFLILREKC